MEAIDRLYSSGAHGGAPEELVNPLTNDPVVTEFGNLAIVNNAAREANWSAKSVASAAANTVMVTGPSLPSPQVASGSNTKTKTQQLGAIHKVKASGMNTKNPIQSVETVPYKKPVARENLNLRIRITRFSHCEMCNERDTSSMVQCDGCDLWYHFSCVEVTSGIAERSWICPACVESEADAQLPGVSKTVPNKLPVRQGDSRKTTSKASSNRSQRRTALRLQMLEEQKQLEQKYLEEKYRILDEEDDDDETVISDDEVGSLEMSKVQGWLMDTSKCGEDDSGLVEEDGLEVQERRSGQHRQSTYVGAIGQRSTLQGFNPNQRSTPRPQVLEANRTRNIGLQNSSDCKNMFYQPSYRRSGTAVQFCQPLENQSIRQHVHSVSIEEHTRLVNNPSRRGHTPAPTNQMLPTDGRNQKDSAYRFYRQPESDPREVEENVCILNRSQLAARQAVSKELPEFYGNPEDWPLFFSMYNSSTQMCGFTNEENMLRLRKCLKGKALDAVRCRLLHPSNVNGVISTLRMLYGRPEAIIQASIRKIRSLPSPQIEKLDTVVNFALTVENLVATIEACGIEDFVYNASLKIELVDRLPPGLKLDWAKHSRNNPAPNLLDFSS